MHRLQSNRRKDVDGDEDSESQTPSTHRGVNKRRMIGGNLVDHIDFWRGDIVQTRFGNGEIVGRSEVLPNTTMYKLRHNVSKYPLLFSTHLFEKN